MAHVSDLIATDINAYLQQHQHKSLLRFITCGSVDDGKSTLIGRLLYESKMLFDDQLSALEADSKKVGTRGEQIDYALLMDGLAAEREQGITIDVAYRFFSTDKRKFIVADTPGHEQYTRNMATGASTADLAILLVDARKGLLPQTRRHSTLVSLIGVRHVVLAVNKMDLVDYSQDTFEQIKTDYLAFAKELGIADVVVIPISGVEGDNIVEKSANTPWYDGVTLMHHLETVELDEAYLQRQSFRLPVQWVNRPNLDFRGFSGTVTGGVVQVGDELVVQPSGQSSTVARIVTADGDLEQAVAGQSVTITLADEIDVSRGDVLCPAKQPMQPADHLTATLVWMHEQALEKGRSYLIKIGCRQVAATVTHIDYVLDVVDLSHDVAETLALNEIGQVQLRLDRVISVDTYTDNRDTGGFILIDRMSNATVAAGMVVEAAEQAGGEDEAVDAVALARLKGQRPTLVQVADDAAAQCLQVALHQQGIHTYVLPADAEHADVVAQHLLQAGIVVISSVPVDAGGFDSMQSSDARQVLRQVLMLSL